MNELINYERHEHAAVITLNNGKANAISPELIEQFNQALDKAESDNAVVIITAREGMLSGGYDLKVMGKGIEEAMALVKAGSTLSKRLLSFPTPVVVACSGHAIAKGAFLLLSADLRIGAEGPYKIGLNEVVIGMTMHHAGIEIARARLNTRFFNRSVINAEIFDPESAVTAGFLDKTVPQSELMPTALAAAEQLSQLNMKAHKGTKLKSRAEYLATLDKAIELDGQVKDLF